MERRFETQRQPVGSDGWVEGYEYTKIPVTILKSKSTGIKVKMYGHDVYSGNDIKTVILKRYPKEIRMWAMSMKNKDIESDFGIT